MNSKKLLEKAERDLSAIQRHEPLSVLEQWTEVEGWREYLVEAGDLPFAKSINQQWQALQDATGMSDDLYRRGEKLRATDDSPLVVLFYFIEMGLYPPPELLLGLLDAWNRYEGGRGKLSLEEAFFGPTKKGIGNSAARRQSEHRLSAMRWEFDQLLREGKSRKDIAEELSDRRGGKPDADSILRMLRGFNGLAGRKGAEK